MSGQSGFRDMVKVGLQLAAGACPRSSSAKKWDERQCQMVLTRSYLGLSCNSSVALTCHRLYPSWARRNPCRRAFRLSGCGCRATVPASTGSGSATDSVRGGRPLLPMSAKLGETSSIKGKKYCAHLGWHRWGASANGVRGGVSEQDVSTLKETPDSRCALRASSFRRQSILLGVTLGTASSKNTISHIYHRFKKTCWRKGRDSNPRYAINVCTRSRRVP
jgi:hypothetical protein